MLGNFDFLKGKLKWNLLKMSWNLWRKKRYLLTIQTTYKHGGSKSLTEFQLRNYKPNSKVAWVLFGFNCTVGDTKSIKYISMNR